MKKFFVAAILAIFVIGFASSCKSECECTAMGVTVSSKKMSKQDCKDLDKASPEMKCSSK